MNILSGVTISSIFAGYMNSFVVSSTGSLYAWGDNGLGQLGLGDLTSRTSPTLVPSSSFANEAIVSVDGGYSRTIIFTTQTKKVFSSGDNGSGALGSSAATGLSRSSTPLLVTLPSFNVGETVSYVRAGGSSFGIGLTTSGRVFAWGGGSSGQLGTGSYSNQNVPVFVDTSSNSAISSSTVIVEVAAGYLHTLARSNTGQLYSWGTSSNGLLCLGAVSSSVVYPRAISMSGALAGKTITKIAAGYMSSFMLASSGELFGCGSSTYLSPSGNVPQLINTGALSGRTVLDILTKDEVAYVSLVPLA